jgi:hypothetical protein
MTTKQPDVDDLSDQEHYRAAKERKLELDARREDRHTVGERRIGIIPSNELDIGV